MQGAASVQHAHTAGRALCSVRICFHLCLYLLCIKPLNLTHTGGTVHQTALTIHAKGNLNPCVSMPQPSSSCHNVKPYLE